MKRKHYFAKFYLNKRYLGCGYIPEGSSAEERKSIARTNGIQYYTHIIGTKGFKKRLKYGKRKAHDFKPKSAWDKIQEQIKFNQLRNFNLTKL